MWWDFNSSEPSYEPLREDKDPEELSLSDVDVSDGDLRTSEKSWFHWTRIGIGLVLTIVILVWGWYLYGIFKRQALLDYQTDAATSNHTLQQVSPTDGGCNKRREWRTLSAAEKQSYTTAVKCLLDQPSVLNLKVSNTSAYSDFPYIHAHVGYRTHNSAPFLPWHRYFLHLYESTLKKDCDYDGGLVYWDWTLDADNLGASPVFNLSDGFGGDGDINGPITVGNHGRCIVDGPFAGIQVLWYDVKYQPHCLSRGFRNDGGTGMMNGKDVSADSIAEALKLDNYESFVRRMEAKVHDAIPFGIGGDFETFTAPFDPLFYLHHVQLDRIWWLWQRRDDSQRLLSYDGHNARHSLEMAQLTDKLHMGGLAPDIEVAKVMDTSGGDNLLCYSY